jgi:hypothetical protein
MSVIFDFLRFAYEDYMDAQQKAEEATNPMHYDVGKPMAFETGVYTFPKYIVWKPDAATISSELFEFNLQKYLTQKQHSGGQISNNYACLYNPQEGSYRGKLTGLTAGPSQLFKSTANDSSSSPLSNEQARTHLLKYLAKKKCSDSAGRNCTVESVTAITCYVVKTETFIETRSRADQMGGNAGIEGNDLKQNIWDVDQTLIQIPYFQNTYEGLTIPRTTQSKQCYTCNGAGKEHCDALRRLTIKDNQGYTTSKVLKCHELDDYKNTCSDCNGSTKRSCRPCRGTGSYYSNQFLQRVHVNLIDVLVLKSGVVQPADLPDSEIARVSEVNSKEIFASTSGRVTPPTGFNELVDRAIAEALGKASANVEGLNAFQHQQRVTVLHVPLTLAKAVNAGKSFRWYIIGNPENNPDVRLCGDYQFKE